MKRRHPNHRLVKIHRSYTVEEIAKLFGIHKNTVRHWVKEGLATVDDKRPMLILGHVLIAFLQARRVKNKQTCKPGELYCVRCRAPKSPAGDMAEYSPSRRSSATLLPFAGLQFHYESARQYGQNRGVRGKWTSAFRKHFNT